MTQKTLVVKVPRSAFQSARDALESAYGSTADWRRVAHAEFSIKADGVVATLYSSGKAVIQGPDPETFAARFFEGASAAGAKTKKTTTDDELPVDVAACGSDETGKGDFFGPLVVAATFVTPEQVAELEDAGVTDSKALTDRRVHELAGFLESRVAYEVRRLDPPDYNARYAEVRNVNLLLAEMHAECLAALKAAHPAVEVAVVDRFGNESLVQKELEARSTSFERLIQVPRAERHPAVAAASILARAAFLDGIRACEERCATDLHKGAGAPVDVAARRVVGLGGAELLAQVAKVHFKNHQRALS